MHITINKITIEFSENEVWSLACHVKNNLEASIDTHYNCLQQEQDGEPVFYEMRQKDIEMMKSLYLACARPDMAEEAERIFKKKFQAKREERLAKNN